MHYYYVRKQTRFAYQQLRKWADQDQGVEHRKNIIKVNIAKRVNRRIAIEFHIRDNVIEVGIETEHQNPGGSPIQPTI